MSDKICIDFSNHSYLFSLASVSVQMNFRKDQFYILYLILCNTTHCGVMRNVTFLKILNQLLLLVKNGVRNINYSENR